MSMEEHTDRERSPPPDPAENAAAEIPVPNSPTPTGRTFQDTFNPPQMPTSPTGGQGLTQEALIEVLRNQHQNIVQQQNLIAGQGAQISELTKLVSGLVQMQTDVLKDQAQREADERERKAEEEKKAAEEAATSSTPRTGSLFTSPPKKSDSKYSGSSGGKMESYIPNCPQLEIKDSGRRHEINTWLSFRERFGSWLCLLDECYAAELQEAVKQTVAIEQGKLAPEAAVRSSKLYHWMKQAMSGYKRGLDIAFSLEREQGGLTCGYELFRRINNMLGVTTRAEALSLREAVMRLDVNGLKSLGCPSAGSVKNPLDTCLFLGQEFARLREQCAAFTDLQMQEVDQIMVIMRCLPQEIHRHLAFHGKSSTMRELIDSPEFYEQQSKALDFSRDSHKGNPVGYDRPPKGSHKGGKDRTPKSEGKGKEIRCRRCGKPGHAEKDCWSKSPKRTDKDKGKGKGNEKGGKPKGGKDRSHSPYDSKRKGSPKGGKPKGGKGEPKGGKGPKGGKPKGARASVGEEDEEDILGMGCALDMTVPPDVLLNQLHSYGNRLTTSSVADTDATDPHFLVDSGASIHLISQSLVDEGYLRICQEWAVNERCTTANGQEMILNRCVEAEFSTYALRSRHVSFLECDGAAASSPDAASSAAASSRAAAPSPAAPTSSSLSPVSRSFSAGSQLQRPQKLRVTGLIGYGQVSLLSVALLASKGWTFTCSPGKSGSRTSREVDKQAKPPCLSLSHFGGHDQVPNRTKSSRTHLDIFLWCNVPWISIVHPGAVDVDMSSSLHSLQYTSDVDPSLHHVDRHSSRHHAVRDSVLRVAERDGSSSVHERIDSADPVQPRFRRVEHAFGCLGREHRVERREEKERAGSEHSRSGTDGTSARHCDRSSRATGCGKGSVGTKGRYHTKGRDTESCSCHDGTREEYRSDRETSRTGTREESRSHREAIGTSRKGKGFGDGEARIRSSKGSAGARDPREAFCRANDNSGGNLRAGGDLSNEGLVKLASSTRSERRGEADQKSSQAASAETAASFGSSRGTETSSSKRAIPAEVVDRVRGRSGTKGFRPESAQEAHQSPKERADDQAEIGRTRSSSLPGYCKGRVHGPEQASRLDHAKGTSATGVFRVACEKGVHRDQALKGDHDGELDSFFRCIGCRGYGGSTGEYSSPGPEHGAEEPNVIGIDGPRTSDERNRRPDWHHGRRRSCRQKKGYQAWDCLLCEAEASAGSEVHEPGQVPDEASGQRSSVRGKCQYFRLDVGDSPERGASSPRADRGESEEVGRSGRTAENTFDPTDQSQVSANRASTATRPAAELEAASETATDSAAKAATYRIASPGSADASEGQDRRRYRSGQRQAGGDSGAEDTAEDAACRQTESQEPSSDRGTEGSCRGEPGTEGPGFDPRGRQGQAYRGQEGDSGFQGREEGYRDPHCRGRGRSEVSADSGSSERERIQRVSLRCEESGPKGIGRSDGRSESPPVSYRVIHRESGRREGMGERARPPREGRGRSPKGAGAVSVRKESSSFRTWPRDPASATGRVLEMESRRRGSREPVEGEANLSRADSRAASIGRSGFDASTDSGISIADYDREPGYAARSASSASVRRRDCLPKGSARASVQVFGREGGREVGRDVRNVQVPSKKEVEPPIRASAHFSNPAFDVVRKKEIVCTAELEPEFEYPVELRGNRLAKHILQSHTPYDPSCAVCLMSKGLKRAPKRTDQVTNEVQMDIANLCAHPKSPNMYRYVALWNRTHGMIATAAIYVDQASTIRVLTAAINHCSSTGAMVLSDEGRDLTALINELIRLKVVSRHETSRPGRHATGAERAVRTLKTQLGCIRTVLYQRGLMLGSESLRYAAANACHVHNAFQLQANSSLTPYQRMRISVTNSGEVPNTTRVMPFGCLVFARPTDGYLEKVKEANARHFVPGIYLTPKLSSLGHFVAFEGSQDATVVVPVRDLKIASPIRFVAGLGMLCEIPDSKSGVKQDRIERLPTDLSKPQKLVDLPIHEGEPPWYWSEVNKTSRCPACSSGSETGHSVKCRNRYKKYLEEEYKRIVPIEDESSVPVVPEGLEEGVDTEGQPESQKESEREVPESESEREKKKRKSIDDEWDRFHREHEEKETGERFPEFDDVPFHAPKGQGVDTEPTPMQEDLPNPYEIGKNPEPIEDDRMSEGYEPTEVPEGYKAPESPGESPMDLDVFQRIPKGRKNRNHDHWEVDLDKLVLRRVHHRSRKCVFAASSLPLPMPEDQLVGIQRTYYVDAVDERPVDEIPRDQFKIHVSEFGTQTAPLGRHWKGFTELPIKQLYMYDHQGNAIASLSDLGKELWEKVKDPLSRCSDDEVERFLSSVQEGVLEYSRKVPKETEESKFDAKAESCQVWFGGRWIVLRKPSRATSDIGEGPLDVDATFEGMHTEVIALEKHKTGQVVNKDEAQEYCKMHGIRIISTRWVVVNKHDAIKGDIVRSRLVVRDFATGPSAAELGVSSPTASSEALKVVLSYLAQKSSFRKKSKRGGVGKTAWVLDVSTAFLHAPVIHPAVVSLPTGMEDEDGEPLFVILEKAMNGLRSAGMSWYRHLADLLDQEGLTACVTEKTIFAGRYRKGVAETEEENHLIVLMYVDDLLVVGDDRNIQKLVDELSKKLRLKVTGKLEEDRIRFLGKVIEKEEDGTIALYMEKEYYEGMVNLYPGGKESQATPNLFQLYDRDREEDRKPLSVTCVWMSS